MTEENEGSTAAILNSKMAVQDTNLELPPLDLSIF